MDDIQRMAIERSIEEQFHEQAEAVGKAVLQGLKDTDDWPNIFSKMVINAILISTKIAATMTADMLIDAGLIEPADINELRKSMFSVVGKKNPEP